MEGVQIVFTTGHKEYDDLASNAYQTLYSDFLWDLINAHNPIVFITAYRKEYKDCFSNIDSFNNLFAKVQKEGHIVKPVHVIYVLETLMGGNESFMWKKPKYDVRLLTTAKAIIFLLRKVDELFEIFSTNPHFNPQTLLPPLELSEERYKAIMGQINPVRNAFFEILKNNFQTATSLHPDKNFLLIQELDGFSKLKMANIDNNSLNYVKMRLHQTSKNVPFCDVEYLYKMCQRLAHWGPINFIASSSSEEHIYFGHALAVDDYLEYLQEQIRGRQSNNESEFSNDGLELIALNRKFAKSNVRSLWNKLFENHYIDGSFDDFSKLFFGELPLSSKLKWKKSLAALCFLLYYIIRFYTRQEEPESKKISALVQNFVSKDGDEFNNPQSYPAAIKKYIENKETPKPEFNGNLPKNEDRKNLKVFLNVAFGARSLK